MRHKEVAIIVAGGKGLRLPGDTPKQFLEIGGLPVLMHTIKAFLAYNQSTEIVLVLPVADFSRWENLCRQYSFHHPVTQVAGGETRFQSVKNGLDSVDAPGVVAIHDGVRPLVTPTIIAASFEIARQRGSAVASVPLKESIRQLGADAISPADAESKSIQSLPGTSLASGRGTQAVDRSRYRIMQTPQTFDIGLLKSAYSLPENDALTDDASVAERAGHSVTLIEGSYENLKITTPVDLVVAEAIIRSRAPQ